MSWLLVLIGRLFRKRPKPVSNLRIFVIMKTITVSWDIPIIREDGRTLPKAEIVHTEVLASSDSGANFTSLAQVKPDATQTIVRDFPDGTYTFRLIVTDIFGLKSKPVDVTGTVKSAPPGFVTNVKIVVT